MNRNKLAALVALICALIGAALAATDKNYMALAGWFLAAVVQWEMYDLFCWLEDILVFEDEDDSDEA